MAFSQFQQDQKRPPRREPVEASPKFDREHPPSFFVLQSVPTLAIVGKDIGLYDKKLPQGSESRYL